LGQTLTEQDKEENVLMNNQNQEVKITMDMIRSCFNELQLPILEEKLDEKGIGTFETQIGDGNFSMILDVICRPNDTQLEIKAEFSKAFDVENYAVSYMAINYINGELMDLGHFAVDTRDGGMLFRASVDISDKSSRLRQLTISLKRFINQGMHRFNALMKMANTDQCPLKELRNAISQMREEAMREGRE
jgi:hypothetical protein